MKKKGAPMNNDERVLRLSDLLSILLRNLKSIVCITLVFALLGSAYAFTKAHHSDQSAAVQTQTKNIDELETRYALSSHADEIANGIMACYEEKRLSALWDRIDSANDNINKMGDYLAASPITSLDPYNCSVADVSLLIRDNANNFTDERSRVLFNTGDRAAAVISSICTLDTSVLEKTRQILGIDSDLCYVQQLVNVFNDNGVVHIRIYSDNLDAAEKAIDNLYGTVVDRLHSTDTGFSFEKIGRYSGNIVDVKLQERKNAQSAEYDKASAELRNAESALFALDTELESFQSAASLASERSASAKQELEAAQIALTQPEAVAQPAGLSVRTIALATVLGLFVGCFAVLSYELFSVKLNSQSELLRHYSFPLLGLLPSKKKWLFDKTIRRLEGETGADYETAARAAAQALLSVSESRSVCFVSSLGKETASTLLPYLDCRLSVCGDILSDPDAVKSLSSFDSIILVEQRGRSNLSLIDSEVLRAKALGKDILGIVLL